MKKWIALLMACMLLPLCALADGDGGIATPRNYDELLKAMNTARYSEISIRPGFVWPTEEVTLDLTNEDRLSIFSGMEIPANVTVNCAHPVGVSNGPGDVVVNGAWNCTGEKGLIYNPGGNTIYNGEVSISCEKRVRLENYQFAFNAPVHLNAYMLAHDLVLGDGVVIDGDGKLQFSGTVSVPEGAATIQVQLNPAGSSSEQPTLQGEMTVQKLNVSKNSPCVLAEGSHVTVEKLAVNEEGQLTVNGSLELPMDSTHNTMSGTIHLNDTGVLIIQPSARLAQADWGQITGTGTLMINAVIRENGKPYATPQLFGLNAMKGLPEGKIAPTVKIIKNWED